MRRCEECDKDLPTAGALEIHEQLVHSGAAATAPGRNVATRFGDIGSVGPAASVPTHAVRPAAVAIPIGVRASKSLLPAALAAVLAVAVVVVAALLVLHRQHGPNPVAPADLPKVLVADLPPGFVMQPDSVGDTGPSDFAKAARDDGKDDAAAVLNADHFVAGYQRFWNGPGGQHLVVYLYEFHDSAGATAYKTRTVVNDVAEPTNKGVATELGSIPHATELTAPAAPTTAVVVFTKGPYLVQVVGDAPGGGRALAEQVAKRQHDRL